jgi:serine/threonine-protein kinase
MTYVCPSCQAANDDTAETCFTCGSALSATLRLGSVIAGRYEIQAQLGKGGMGVVYRAHDRLLDEQVAIKVLRPEVARDAEISRRFQSEIKLARRVSHKNVCRIHEYGEDQGLRYISMEYMQGVDLRQVIRERGGLPTDEAFTAALQIADGPLRDPRRRRHPPRPEDAEHHARHARPDPADGLRDREGMGRRRRVGDRHRPGDGHARVHEPGAGPRREDRLPQRHLRAGDRDLRAVHGAPAVPGGDAARDHPEAPPGGTAARRPRGRAHPAPRARGPAEGARQAPERAPHDRGGAGPGDARGARRPRRRPAAGDRDHGGAVDAGTGDLHPDAGADRAHGAPHVRGARAGAGDAADAHRHAGADVRADDVPTLPPPPAAPAPTRRAATGPYAPRHPAAAPSRTGLYVGVGAVVLLVFLAVAGLVGWKVWQAMQEGGTTPSSTLVATSFPTAPPQTVAPVPPTTVFVPAETPQPPPETTVPATRPTAIPATVPPRTPPPVTQAPPPTAPPAPAVPDEWSSSWPASTTATRTPAGRRRRRSETWAARPGRRCRP